MNTPAKFLAGAASMLGLAAVTGQPEFLILVFLLGVGAAGTQRAARQFDRQLLRGSGG